MTTQNRITAHAEATRTKIHESHPDFDIGALEGTLDIDSGEHFAFQEAQAHAHASGLITTDEALTVYGALGEVQASGNGGWQPHVDLALKVTITQLMTELIARKLKGAA